MTTVCLGIVAYDGFDGQVTEDYMRLMFHLGRRTEFDWQLAIKTKSEQFRARTAIVNVARQYAADYLWMLDDDHILDLSCGQYPTDAYDLPVKLIQRLEANPKIGIVGALYYQRGGDQYPVIMQEGPNGVPHFLHASEVAGTMQRVDVTGGGCMMMPVSIFDKIEDPWFQPEHEFGTDIQLCRRVRDAGLEVWCDTSLKIGHIRHEKEIIAGPVPPKGEAPPMVIVPDLSIEGVGEALQAYREAACEWLGMKLPEVWKLGETYHATDILDWKGPSIRDYYATRNKNQLARQVLFHHHPIMRSQFQFFLDRVKPDMGAGVDYGCGSAPIGFELARRGHYMDFIDVPGAPAYEFVKWRAEEEDIPARFYLEGPYDFALFMDSIEHLEDWKEALDSVICRLNDGGILLTNFFQNQDFDNPEHISMDHEAVHAHLREWGLVPEAGGAVWVNLGKEEKAA